MRKKICAASVLALGGSMLMPVQGATERLDMSADDADTVYSLPAFSVIANRANAKTPVAYTTVSAAELNAHNDGKDLTYLLQMTPSVITTSDAGAGMGYTSMRVRGSDASRINITANGVPINNPESHNVYWVNMPDLASSLRDVQIQRGAGTSVNGAGAFGASVNMLTDLPSDTAYGQFAGAYGMYNTHKLTLKAGSGLLGGHWTVDARLSQMGSDGYIERAKSNLWSYMGQIGYRNKDTKMRLLAFGGKEKTYMAWDYATKEQMAEYGRRYNPCGEYIDSDGQIAYYPDQNDNFIQHHFQFHLEQRISDSWNLNAALHYTTDDGYYEQYKTRRTLVEYGLEPFWVDGEKVKKADLIRLKKNRNYFGGGLFSVSYSGTKLNAAIGGGFNHFTGNHFGNIAWVRNYVGPLNPLEEYYRNRGEKSDGNLYGRAIWDFNRNLSVFADLQWRYINYRISGLNDTYDYNTEAMQRLAIHEIYNFFNPKAGVNYTWRNNNRVFASWSVAHREPARDNFTDGNPADLPKPERMFDYEAGYVYSGDLFSGGIQLYYMDYKNQLVVTGQLSDTGNPMSVNVPRSYRMGIELQGELKPCRWFNWELTATLSRNRIKDFVEYIYEDEWTNPISINRGDTPIAFSPGFTFANSFKFKFGAFDAALDSRYVGKQYMNNARIEEQTLDAYFVPDLHLGYRFAGLAGIKHLKIGFSIYNIFNAWYFSNGYSGAGYYMDGTERVIYRYAGYAAQAPAHVMGTLALEF